MKRDLVAEELDFVESDLAFAPVPTADRVPSEAEPTQAHPWWWVPSLYFTQALPNSFVATLSTYAYTRLQVSKLDIGYASWLALPWMLKPFWSPVVELFGTERRWIWTTELLAGAAFAFVAVGYTSEHFFLWTAVGYLLLAVASATHDIAADGFYMRALSRHDQTWFTGIRSVAFRGGLVFCEVFLLALVGALIKLGFDPARAWAVTHGLAAAGIAALASYHAVVLPITPDRERTGTRNVGDVFAQVIGTFATFFATIPLATALPFLLLYRFAEAQLVRFAGVFLLDPRAEGGLGLNEGDIAFINGVLGIGALLAGGVAGSVLAARHGLRNLLLPMAVFINLPNLVYVLLAYYQPQSLALVGLGVAVEKLGYGFGFAGYMLYMLYLAQGKHQTSFYAICTGFMTLGLILPGSLAGYPLNWLGYVGFFTWIMFATIPSFLVTGIVYWNLDPTFGRREESS